MKINILGTEYTIEFRKEEDDPKLSDRQGYCDSYAHKIVISIPEEDIKNNTERLDLAQQKVIRHELVHAFLFQSGLWDCCDWATEECVDWIAWQFPKMVEVMKTAECI